MLEIISNHESIQGIFLVCVTVAFIAVLVFISVIREEK